MIKSMPNRVHHSFGHTTILLGTTLNRSYYHCDANNIPDSKWVNWVPRCNDVLANATSVRWTQLTPSNRTTECPWSYDLIDCFLEILPGHMTAEFSSVQVILGLTPTILAGIAPSIGEIAMLSRPRPILAFLISIGCPAIYASRTLNYDDPLAVLKTRDRLFVHNIADLPIGQAVTSIFQYLIVLGAIANIFHAGWILGIQIICPWKAAVSYLPFLWAILPAVAHFVGVGSWYTSESMREIRKLKIREGHRLEWLDPPWLRYLVCSEFPICASRPQRRYLAFDSRVYNPGWYNRVAVAGNVAASGMGFMLLVFGTLRFSSLLFISTLDAVETFARYFLSSFSCRMVLEFELSGLAMVERGHGDVIEMEGLKSVPMLHRWLWTSLVRKEILKVWKFRHMKHKKQTRWMTHYPIVRGA